MKMIVTIVQFFILSLEFYAQEFYFENENVFSYDKVYAININDDDKLDEIDNNNYNMEILKEIKIENNKEIKLNGNEKIFSFININNNIDIILLKNNSIECLYEIKNYLQDNELIIKQKECQIFLNQQDCFKLYKQNQFIYIIQCNYNSTHTIIQILNSTQILDQIIIPIQSNCQSDSTFNQNTQILIIFNKLCQTTLFYSIQIINNTFYNYIQYDLQDDFSINNIPNSILISIQFCSSESITINFHNIFIEYSLPQKKILMQARLEKSAKIIQRFCDCKSNHMFIEEEVESNQLMIRKHLFNISSQNYIQSYLIQQLITLHLKDELVVMFNNKIQQHIKYSFQNVLALAELPLIFAIKEEDLYIYKVNYPQYYFTASKDLKFIKRIKIGQGLLIPSSSIDYKKLSIFTEQKVQFLLKQSKFSYFMENSNDKICINHSTLQQSFPFEIQIFQQQQNIIFYEQNSIQKFCFIDISFKSEVFIIQEMVADRYIILQIQDHILSISSCEDNKLKRTNKIKIQQDYIKMFSFPNILNIIIIYNYKIVHISLKNEQIIQQFQNFNEQILNCIQNNDIIYIIFEDCSKVSINLNSERLYLFLEEKYPFDCKLSLQFTYNELFITEDQIMIFSKEQFRRKMQNLQGNKYLMSIQLYPFVIIVNQIQNVYQLQLFFIIYEEYIFLYNLPTYDFIIKDSIEYKTLKTYFMIRASKQNINYLLIYDLSKAAILSLITITKIDQDQIFFLFLTPTQFLYYSQDQFIIQNIHFTCFNYKHNFIIDKFIYKDETTLQIKSQVNNEILEVKLGLISLNDDYNLRQLNQMEILYSNNTFNLSNIYGNIENIEILPQDDYQIIYPLTFTSQEYKFIIYESGLCYNYSNIIILNCFKENQLYINQNTIKNILHVSYHQNKPLYQIVYETQTKNLNIIIIDTQFDQPVVNIEKLQIPESLYKDEQTHNIYKIKTTQDLSIYVLRHGENQLTFNQIYASQLSQIVKLVTNLESSYLFDSTYLFISDSLEQQIQIQFISITQENEEQINYDILYQHRLILNKIIPQTLLSKIFYLGRHLKIFQIKIKKDFIHFELSIFFKQYFTLLIQLSIDKKFESVLQIQSTTILRYQKEFQFNNLLYIDNNFTIFILNNNEFDGFVYVYDISNRNFQHTIDSIQKLRNDDYTSIERFNQSHYILKSNYNIIFITLDKFRFSCKTLCQDIQSIQLTNEVSKIQIQIANVQFNKTQQIQICIILSTFIFILLFQKYQRKNSLQVKKWQQTVQIEQK